MLFNFLFTGDMLYIPQYWWHVVRSYDSPNIAVNMWFGLFNYEDKFQEAGISEDTDVVKVVSSSTKLGSSFHKVSFLCITHILKSSETIGNLISSLPWHDQQHYHPGPSCSKLG